MSHILHLPQRPNPEPYASAEPAVLASAAKMWVVFRCWFWSDALRPAFYKTRTVHPPSHIGSIIV